MHRVAGAVIGKGGELISMIRNMTKCKISLTESNPMLPERVVRPARLGVLHFCYTVETALTRCASVLTHRCL